MGDFLTITCRLPAAAEGVLAEAMARWPVLGCQVQDAGTQVQVTIYLDEAQALELARVEDELRELGAVGVASGHFAHEDWLAEYRRAVTPQAIGSFFWVDPHPGSPTPPPSDRVHLIVEPRQAFGTGSHESTQLVLLLLEELPVVGARVLDVGTGSGILSIAAMALGARCAVAFDIDAEAVFVARQTVAVQPRPLPVLLYAGSSRAVRRSASFDLILANIIPAQLEPLLDDLKVLLADGGRLVISGLLADQRTAFASELAELGLWITAQKEAGEWTALVCVRGEG
ncbi:MAG: 50S ribosomal protein L11 methyltransferase [Acidobacteriota bacterium]